VKRSEFLSHSLCPSHFAQRRVFLALAQSKTPPDDNPPNFLVSFLKHPTIWASQTSPLLDSLLAAGKSSCCVLWRAESPYLLCQVPVMPSGSFFPLPFLSHFSIFPFIFPTRNQTPGPRAGDLQRVRDEPPVAHSHQWLRHLSLLRSPIFDLVEEIRQAKTSSASEFFAKSCSNIDPWSQVCACVCVCVCVPEDFFSRLAASWTKCQQRAL
jgi:hypothetical protein